MHLGQDVSWHGFLDDVNTANPFSYGNSAELDLAPPNQARTSRLSSFASLGAPSPYIGTRIYNSSSDEGANKTTVIRKLAELNVAVHECGGKFPSIAQMSSATSIDIGSSNEVNGTRKIVLFAIDDLLRLTTDFIDILKCLCPAEDTTNASMASIDPKKLSVEPGSQWKPQTLPQYEEPSSIRQQAQCTGIGISSRISKLDEGTIFMIMSCHSRLAEIFSSIFQMIRACIEFSLAPLKSDDLGVILPQLQVGSFASPPIYVDLKTPLAPAKSSAYMFMVMMLSSQLWEQLAEVMAARPHSGMGSVRASSDVLVDTVWNTMLDRTNDMSKTINTTRNLLQRSSVVAD